MNKEMQKIIKYPSEYGIVKIIGDVWVGHYKYLHVLRERYGEIENTLIPYSNGTWVVAVPYDSYGYTHGGKIYKNAVEKVHELEKLHKYRR